MYSFARILIHPGSTPATLFAGDIIGRGPSSALRIQDPRVHEAHAVVSFRDGELCLLPARGALYVDGGAPTHHPVVLREGLECALRRDGRLKLKVLSVSLSPSLLALELDDESPLVLRAGSTYTLRVGCGPWLTRGVGDDADAVVWMEGEEWFIRIGDSEAHLIEPGATFVLPGGRKVRGVPVIAAVDPTHDTNLQGSATSATTALSFEVHANPTPRNWLIRARTADGRDLVPLDDICACFVGNLMNACLSGVVPTKNFLAENVWRVKPHENLPSGRMYHAKRRAIDWLAGLPGGRRAIGHHGTDGLVLVLQPGDSITVRHGA